jgi:hypothetical protein
VALSSGYISVVMLIIDAVAEVREVTSHGMEYPSRLVFAV